MSRKQIKLVTVEDKSLTTSLDRAGYRKKGVQLKVLQSFQEVLNYLEEGHAADLLVINHDYEQIEPLSMLKSLKTHEKLQSTPIIVTSVQSSARVRKSCEEAGADLFVEQPLPRDIFIEKIKSLLEHATRDNTRVTSVGDCEVTWDDGSIIVKVGDLSTSGLLVTLSLPLEKSTEVSLKLPLPGYKRGLKIKGQVVRFIEQRRSDDEQTGTGIRFVEMSKEDRRKLEKYIDKEQHNDSKMLYYL